MDASGTNDMARRRATTPRALAGGAMLAAGLAISASALAQDSVRLSQSEVTSVVKGKKLEYKRTSDGAVIGWDFKGDDTVYYTTPNTRRNTSFSGTYSIGEDGRLCFKWNQDKWLVMQDGCVFLRRMDGKTQIVGTGDSERVRGEVIE